MSEQLSAPEVQNLTQFIGYGRLDAPVWFLGLEESLGKRPSMPEWTAIKELKIRASWPPVIDIKKAHQMLEDEYWNRRNYSSVWRFAARLTMGILNANDSMSDTQSIHEYVIHNLGRENGDTLLGEVLPFPAKNMSDWPFSEVYSDRSSYMEDMLPKRMSLWKSLTLQYRPPKIFAYGRAYWPQYLDLFGLNGWKRISEIIEIKRTPETAIYLLPFMGNGQLSNADVALILNTDY